MDVTCSVCGIHYDSPPKRYNYNIKHGYNFYCSIECKNGVDIDNFWDKVSKEDPKSCWEWNGAMSSGYGSFHYNGKTESAHRVSYRINIGEIPDGLFVCHHCDNPKCVNPNHFFLGTNGDNMRDAIKKGRLVHIVEQQFTQGHNPINKSVTSETMQKVTDFVANNPKMKLTKVAELFSIPYRTLIDSRRKKKRTYFDLK